MKNKSLLVALIVVALLIVAYFLAANPAVSPTPTDIPANEPAAAETIVTEAVSYYGDTEGYLARPAGDGPYPTLVLIHEWWGLNENMEDLAEDFASEGYVALAVDLYNGEVAETPSRAGELAGWVRENTEEAFANLTAATEYLASQSYVNTEQLASVGWCFGGQWSYNMAVNNMGLDAAVMYYGQFSLEDDLEMMRAQILGHFGEDDTLIAVDDVRQFEARLNSLEEDHAIFIYPNAGHAFANEDNAEAYNEEAAELAWQRTLDFLARELE